MYGRGNPWKDFWTRSVIRAGKDQFVAIVDINDFYNQIYHHTVENQLDSSGVTSEIKCAPPKHPQACLQECIARVPCGPHASHILAEMSLIPLDDYLYLKGYSYSRFVDDIHIFCDSHELAQAAVYEVADFLDKSQKLSLNKQKTDVLTPEQFTQRASLMLVDNPMNQRKKRFSRSSKVMRVHTRR